jgi:hypothetical protein
LWCGEILLQFDNNETKVAACPVTDQNDNWLKYLFIYTSNYASTTH